MPSSEGQLASLLLHQACHLVREGGRDQDRLPASRSPFPAVIHDALHGLSELCLQKLINLQQRQRVNVLAVRSLEQDLVLSIDRRC